MDVDEQSLALWHNLVSAVERALADHPRNAAELNVDTEHLNIHVRPRRGEAADIDISFDGVDEVCLEVGLTEAHMWQVGPEPLDETIYRIVAAVAAGHIEEVGSFNATARVQTPSGELSFGNLTFLPIPWRWRKRRSYTAYS